MRSPWLLCALSAAALLTACPDNEDTTDAGTAPQADATPNRDATPNADAETFPDAAPDAEALPDAEPDASVEDATAPDAEPDAGIPGVCGNGFLDRNEGCDDGPNNTDTPCVISDHAFNCTFCTTACIPATVLGSGRLEGQVTSANQEEIGIVNDVVIVVNSNATTTGTIAETRGRFTVYNVLTSDNILVGAGVFESDAFNPVAYGATQVVMPLGHNEARSFNISLLEGCATVATMNVATPISLNVPAICPTSRIHTYAGIELDGGALENTFGQPFSGDARVELIPLPYEPFGKGSINYQWFRSLPGNGVVFRGNGTFVPFESRGAMEVNIVGATNRNSLNFAIPNTAQITFRAIDFSGNIGDTAPLAQYDFRAGFWAERGTATATLSADGNYVWQATISSTGWYTTFDPRPSTGCFRGVVDFEDTMRPVELSLLKTVGSGTPLSSQTVTDLNGEFCVEAPAGEYFDLVANYSPRQDPRRWTGYGSTVASSTGECRFSRGDCIDAGTISIYPVNPVCLKPILYWPDPNTGARVPYTGDFDVELAFPFIDDNQREAGRRDRAYLGKYTADANGSACMQLPEGDVHYFSTREIGLHGSICYAEIDTRPSGLQANNGVCGIDETDCDTLTEIDFYCGS